MDYPKLLISSSYNVFNDGWNGAGVYMCSGNYISETFKLPIYIGSATNLQNRIETEHISSLNRNKHPHNPPLQNAWNKYGEKNFVWWLLETCEPEECFEIEQKYLDLYRPFTNEFGGFNICHFTEKTWLGLKHSSETKQKMSKARAGISPWNKGMKWPEEIKVKISKSSLGKTSPMLGKKHSIIAKNKMLKAWKKTANRNRRGDIPVLCIETNIIYPSATKASKILDISRGHISSVCNGKRKTCGGFHWKFIENNKNE